MNVHERPGFDIDTRARRLQNSLSVGTDVRLTQRFSIDASVTRSIVSFEDDAVFLGANLKRELNRRASRASTTLAYELTPLTKAICLIEGEQARFTFSPARDNNSVRVVPGLEFTPFALVTGRVQVGYLDFDPVSASLPGYRGLTSAVDVGYRLLGTTQFDLQLNRDVSYSVDTAGYYIQTGITGAVTKYIRETWSVSFNAGRHRLAYPDAEIPGGPIDAASRADKVMSFGGGIGYRFVQGLRADFRVLYTSRDSGSIRGQYDNLRVFSSFSYVPH